MKFRKLVLMIACIFIFSGCAAEAKVDPQSEEIAKNFIVESFSDFSNQNDPAEYVDYDSNLYDFIMDKRYILDLLKAEGKFNITPTENKVLSVKSKSLKDGLDEVEIEVVHEYTRPGGQGGVQCTYIVLVNPESKKVVGVYGNDETSSLFGIDRDIDWQSDNSKPLPYSLQEVREKIADYEGLPI